MCQVKINVGGIGVTITNVGGPCVKKGGRSELAKTGARTRGNKAALHALLTATGSGALPQKSAVHVNAQRGRVRPKEEKEAKLQPEAVVRRQVLKN